MADEISAIKELLDRLHQRLSESESPEQRALRNLDALEFPSLVVQIVDFLHPILEPYEAAIYWRLFRGSVLAEGHQYARASVRGMMSGTIVSRSGQSKDLSYAAVQAALSGLEAKGVIQKAGETNREGTLYKVKLPEEIEGCIDRMKTVAENEPKPIDEERELDFYNVAENRLKVFERDAYKCYACGKQLTRFTATLDHLTPVSRGGDNSFENLRTACLHCNSRRGNRPVMDVLL